MSTVLELDVDVIASGPQIRAQKNPDRKHVASLRGAIADLPPIIVREVDGKYQLVDGHHRLAAYREEGVVTITATLEDLGDAEALELATRTNQSHGLPLTTAEQKKCARMMIEAAPDWSDRRIAKAAGLSDHTVSDLRPKPECSTAQSAQLNTPKTEGADGKARPATKAAAQAQQAKVADAIDEDPDAPVRDIAERTGASIGTVSKAKRPDRSRAAVKARWEKVAEMAAEGYSSRQIGNVVGVGDQTLRAKARELGIEIPADVTLGRTRVIDSNRVVEQTVLGLAGEAQGLDLINVGDLDPALIEGWVISLDESLRALKQLRKTLIKEMTQ